jgi:hypothetical protein
MRAPISGFRVLGPVFGPAIAHAPETAHGMTRYAAGRCALGKGARRVRPVSVKTPRAPTNHI